MEPQLELFLLIWLSRDSLSDFDNDLCTIQKCHRYKIRKIFACK